MSPSALKHPPSMDIFPDSGTNMCLAVLYLISELTFNTKDLNRCHKQFPAVGGCAFQFMEIFVETQFTYSLYLQKGLEIFL